MRTLAIACLSLALIGCKSDSPTAPTSGASGSLSFSYTGAGGSGTYSASGAVPANLGNTTLGTTPWAAASLGGGTVGIDIFGAVPTAASTWNIASVEFAQQTIGTFQISSSSCATAFCNIVLIDFGTSANASSFTYICTLDTGTVTLTSETATRLVGTFSGTGTCITPAGASSVFTLTNGAFDVGIFTGVF